MIFDEKTGLTLRTPAEWRREQERNERALYEARRNDPAPLALATAALLLACLSRHLN